MGYPETSLVKPARILQRWTEGDTVAAGEHAASTVLDGPDLIGVISRLV